MALTRQVLRRIAVQSTASGPARQRVVRMLGGVSATRPAVITSPDPSIRPAQGLVADVFTAIGGVAGAAVGQPALGAAVGAAVGGAVEGGSNQTGGGRPGTRGSLVADARAFTQAQCPPGTFHIPGTNRCADLIPGGETTGQGVLVDEVPLGGGDGALTPAVGRFGPAYLPAQVGTINGRPIRRCVAGQVLGRDNLCYERSALRRTERKWRPARKPPITVEDANAIRQAERARKRVKKLAGDVGFTCKKR